MEEISSFEERLSTLKQKGESLFSGCSDQVQAKMSQQVQTQLQGTRDSYSAVCSTAQRVSRQPPRTSRPRPPAQPLRVSTDLPESGPGAAEARQPSGRAAAVPGLAVRRAGGAAASGAVRSAGGTQAGLLLSAGLSGCPWFGDEECLLRR